MQHFAFDGSTLHLLLVPILFHSVSSPHLWNYTVLISNHQAVPFSVRTPLTGGTNFTVEVVSCRDLDLGAVLVYEQGSDPVVVAHTIGDDQLPLPEQVCVPEKFIIKLKEDQS